MAVTTNQSGGYGFFTNLGIFTMIGLCLLIMLAAIGMVLPPEIDMGAVAAGSTWHVATLDKPIQYGIHAMHHEEVVAIRTCLQNNGPAQVWEDSTESDKRYLVCELEPGKFGMLIIRDAGKFWKEVTGFIRKNGTLEKTVRYLGNRAHRLVINP